MNQPKKECESCKIIKILKAACKSQEDALKLIIQSQEPIKKESLTAHLHSN